MPTTPPDQQKGLPVIICIHGQGTNGAIFRLQARRITQALQHRFRFAFVDAPFGALPGPGVLPAFAGLGPFLRWHCDDSTLGRFDITADELEAEREQARALLAGVVLAGGGGGGDDEVVGVMAFSQGTRVATGLLLDEGGLGGGLRFAILICGTFPALLVGGGGGGSGKKGGEDELSSLAKPKQVLDIPSIHLQGSYDPWSTEGVRLKETYYAPGLAKTVKFSGGHQVPAGPKEAAEVAAWVLEVFKP